jgi:hypothetical protein
MKKILVIVSVLMIVIVCTAQAQQKIEPSPGVAQKFSDAFQGATNARWSRYSDGYGVSFLYNGESSIAYFGASGKLIANGRRISENQLPMSVGNRLGETRQLNEKKYGELEMGPMYEFARDGSTQYIIGAGNAKVSLLLVSENDRITVKRTLKDLSEDENKSVAARK